MQKSFLLGVSVGESFAEYSLLSDSKPLAQKRVYISRESLKQSLHQFVNEHADQKPAQAFISLRLPKKLLNFELSGAVAHITTEGFEHWLDICDHGEQLTNKDLLFSIHERILADGTIEAPLKLEDLESIAAKLQLMECKKVCLHFLHSATHPVHVEKAREFLQSKGLEVFAPGKSDNQDEVSRWKKNALNATISGVFSERKAEIISALEGVLSEDRIHFLTSEGKIFRNGVTEPLEGFFAASTALGLHWGVKENADILYLGLENIALISGSQWSSTWESAWGPVEMNHLNSQELEIQPTLGISLNIFGRFDFSTHQEGWEPGPMFLGRGQKPSLLDLWAENGKLAKIQGLEDRLSTPGVQRFKNALFALSKISQTRDSELGHLSKELQSLALQRLTMEAYLQRKTKKMIVAGPLAPVFANVFKKDPDTSLLTDEFCESTATALCGFKALQETL